LGRNRSIFAIFLYGVALYGATIIGKFQQTSIIPLLIIFTSTMLWFFTFINSFTNKKLLSYILYVLIALIFSILFCLSYFLFTLFQTSIAYIFLFIIENILAEIFVVRVRK
jgi:hypothetical protein